MIGWLKWLVAGREMAELEGWRVECARARRWLAESPGVVDALDYVSAAVAAGGGDISQVRERMRAQHAFYEATMALTPKTATGADLDRLASLPTIDLDEVKRLQREAHEHRAWPIYPTTGEPAAYGEILPVPYSDRRPAPEPGRVEYRFLTAECGDAES